MSRDWCRDTAYAIGSTSSSLVSLRKAKLPPPDQVVMVPAAVSYVRGDATRVNDGYRSCNWVWDVISIESFYNLLKLAGFVEGDTYKNLYISTPLREGSFPAQEFRTYNAIMYRPIMSGKEGTPIARSPYAYQSVKITFNKLIEIIP